MGTRLPGAQCSVHIHGSVTYCSCGKLVNTLGSSGPEILFLASDRDLVWGHRHWSTNPASPSINRPACTTAKARVTEGTS
jgi:hypothetical protein